MRLLLLQARKNGDPAAAHERTAFASVLGVSNGVVKPWDLLDGAPDRADLRSADCVLVGGSGDFRVGDAGKHSWITEFIETMGWLTTTDVPVFASCFGFQALVVACGGRIATDKSHAEFGTVPVTVSDAGYGDPLFSEVAPSFNAQFGHADYATDLPSVFVNLASTERNEFQAATIPGKEIYMTQFHPELSMEANRERALMYTGLYEQAGFIDSTIEVMESFRESEEASGLLRRFVTEHVGLLPSIPSSK